MQEKNIFIDTVEAYSLLQILKSWQDVSSDVWMSAIPKVLMLLQNLRRTIC